MIKEKNNENALALIEEVGGYKKANLLISSKYKSSLIENKILALGMARAYTENGRVISKITASELKVLLGISKDSSDKVSGSFYTRLKETAEEMTGRKIYIEDKVNKKFAIYNLVSGAHYENNVFTIKFEPDLSEYLIDIKNNYTYLNLPILLSFEKNYSYRLYEILKSKAFFPKDFKYSKDEFFAHYSISELKLTLGAIDTNSDAVSRALKKNHPDYDYIVNEVAKDKTFDRWSNFKNKVLDVAINEINKKSDLEVRYELHKGDIGGKVKSITFYYKVKEIPLVENVENDISNNFFGKEFTDKKYDCLVGQAYMIIKSPIELRDVRSILKAAHGNLAKIQEVYEMSEKYEDIENLTGWMISAIENNYINVC